MKVYFIIFDKKIFENTESCRTWLASSTFSSKDRVVETSEYYKYKVNTKKATSRLKRILIGTGIATLVG